MWKVVILASTGSTLVTLRARKHVRDRLQSRDLSLHIPRTPDIRTRDLPSE